MAEAKSIETLVTAAIVSATVATIVALSVEWAAKPRLEVRKERLLQKARARRDAVKNLLRVREMAVRLSHHRRLGAASKPENRAAYSTLYRGFHENLLKALDAFDAAFMEVASPPRDKLYGPTTSYLGSVMGIAKSDRSLADQGWLIALLTLPLLEMWTVPRWRLLAKRRYKSEFDKVERQFADDEQVLLDLLSASMAWTSVQAFRMSGGCSTPRHGSRLRHRRRSGATGWVPAVCVLLCTDDETDDHD